MDNRTHFEKAAMVCVNCRQVQMAHGPDGVCPEPYPFRWFDQSRPPADSPRCMEEAGLEDGIFRFRVLEPGRACVKIWSGEFVFNPEEVAELARKFTAVAAQSTPREAVAEPPRPDTYAGWLDRHMAENSYKADTEALIDEATLDAWKHGYSVGLKSAPPGPSPVVAAPHHLAICEACRVFYPKAAYHNCPAGQTEGRGTP